MIAVLKTLVLLASLPVPDRKAASVDAKSVKFVLNNFASTGNPIHFFSILESNKQFKLEKTFDLQPEVYKYSHSAYSQPSFLFYGDSVIISCEYPARRP